MASSTCKDLTVYSFVTFVLLGYVFFNRTGKDTYTFADIPVVPYIIQTEISNRSELDTVFTNKRSPDIFADVKEAKRKPGRKVVILLAYMHTGSTFLGSILQSHEHTFYEYENLRSLMYSTRAGKVIYFLNGTDLRLRPNTDVINVHHNIHPVVGADAVKKMITCNHQELDLATLTNHYFSLRSSVNRDLKSFFSCQEEIYGQSTSLRAVSALKYVENLMLNNTSRAKDIVRRCLPLLTEKCKQSKVVLEKFIRMTMEMAKIVLESSSNLKIVHLFRDPRAMLDSQVRKGDSGAGKLLTFDGRAKYTCQQMAKDHRLAKELDRSFPGQIYTLRYEDMVDSPMETIKKVFSFIGIPFTKTDEVFVRRHSRPRYPVNDTTPLTSWRQHIGRSYLRIVDKYCSSLYKEFGYLRFKSYAAITDAKQKDHTRR